MSALLEESAAAPGLARRLLGYIDWKINPVLLRDLRLYTRGRLLMSVYFLTLIALVLLTIVYAFAVGEDGGDGRMLLSALTVILCIVVGALVPNLVFERFRSEFANRATELALMSPLTPARLVRGKLVGAWCVSLMVISTAAPMMATAYLLGGVNIIEMLGVVGGIALAALVMPTPQLLMATQRQARSFSRIVASLVFVGQLILMYIYGSFLYSFFAVEDGWRDAHIFALATLCVSGVLIAQFLYFATVSRLRSVNEYRDAAPRLSLSAAAVVGGLAAAVVMHFVEKSAGRSGLSREETAGLIACFVSYTFCLGFLVVSYTVPTPPPSVLRQPRGAFSRTFLQPGLRSLVAYFIPHALVILYFAHLGVLENMGQDMRLDDEWRFGLVAMSPIMALAMGINLYFYIALSAAKDKRSPNLLPLTILFGNIAIAIVSIFMMVTSAFSDDSSTGHLLAIACNPLGLLYGAVESWRRVSVIGSYSVVFMAIQFALMLPILFGAGGKRFVAKGAGNAQG